MAYTIIKSDGQVLTTIADGTINTNSTSVGLPGRNYAGYGQTLDTNFVHMIENFAKSTPPPNPLRGQLWYDTNSDRLKVCPTDGEANSLNWLALTTTASNGLTSFGAINVTGNVVANNIVSNNQIIGNSITVNYATVNTQANILLGNLTTANVGTLNTALISTGGTPANTTAGALTGTWTVNGGGSGNTLILTNGNLYIGGANTGVRTDTYMWANGDPLFGGGSPYSNANVAGYLPTFTGTVGVGAATFRGTTLTTGAAATPGTITGTWTLSAGSSLNATYADLAERFEADSAYDAGTVVELGGEKEITAVKYELSEDVFGVISNTAGYILNAHAGNDLTHPTVAVSGRVKVRVTGIVKKGQRLVSAGNGTARAANDGEATAFNTIGRSLEDKHTDDVGYVLAVVMIK
jgi:hypothetical protein